MKKIFNISLKVLSLIFIILSLFIFVFLKGKKESVTTQIGSILFPLIGGYLIVGLLILLLIGTVILWRNGWGNKDKFLLVLVSMIIVSLGLGYSEWREMKNVVQKNGGNVTLLGVQYDSKPSKPDEQIVYATKDNEELSISVYNNSKEFQNQKQPVFVYIHGGGWSSGNAESSAWLHRSMANQGYIVFSVNYRLATENNPTWEKATEDVLDAMRWIKKHVAEYGGDTDNIILSGESAGGHLALLYTGLVITGEIDGPLPKAVAVMYPAIDLRWTSKNGRYLSVDPIPNIVEKYIGGDINTYGDRLEQVDPMNYINEDMPPVLIMHGEDDTLVTITGSERYVDQLKQVGGDAQLIKIPYSNHGLNIQVTISLLLDYFSNINGLSIKK